MISRRATSTATTKCDLPAARGNRPTAIRRSNPPSGQLDEVQRRDRLIRLEPSGRHGGAERFVTTDELHSGGKLRVRWRRRYRRFVQRQAPQIVEDLLRRGRCGDLCRRTSSPGNGSEAVASAASRPGPRASRRRAPGPDSGQGTSAPWACAMTRSPISASCFSGRAERLDLHLDPGLGLVTLDRSVGHGSRSAPTVADAAWVDRAVSMIYPSKLISRPSRSAPSLHYSPSPSHPRLTACNSPPNCWTRTPRAEQVAVRCDRR